MIINKTLKTILKILLFICILALLVDWIAVETSILGIVAFIIGMTVNTIIIVSNNRESESD